MKLMYNGRHIKNVPEVFVEVPELHVYIEDEHTKRLTKNERKSLLNALMAYRLGHLFNDIKFLKGSAPVLAVKYVRRDGVRYAIRFSNGQEVWCSGMIFQHSPVKKIYGKTDPLTSGQAKLF